jgi:shikimate kinase
MAAIKKVYIFIGPPSSGKSFLGKKFAEAKGFTFYEADEDYLPEYRDRVKVSEDEVEAVYNEFYAVVIDKIKQKLREFNKPVVVATATGKARNRKRFIDEFGDEMLLVYIKSPYEKLINNAVINEFPRLKAVSKLSEENAAEITAHLTKKYRGYEVPLDAVVIENDYTEAAGERVLGM